MKRLIAAISLLLVHSQTHAFQFEKADPNSLGFDSEVLATIQDKFEDLYQEGRIPNYVMGVYSGDKNIYLAQNGTVSIEGGQAVRS